ncbi:membrane protein [Staphylococcus phage Koomba-kaat_1]|nr:hypothetical protein RP15_gp142 [Staphylococcus phage vB_Sau-RP15]UVD42418.1 hypothetical protein [Staphylococcus phage vB_SauM-V1SA19]UVT34816.1 hypothetical protein [Staphylococcus phage vB_SauM-V1SA20]UXE02843.1 membrane protein [Staphylococcus phage Koomba-kaat_1]
MNTRLKSFLYFLMSIVLFPFTFLYLLAYHHFEDKQHFLTTCIEYIELVYMLFMHSILGKKVNEPFNLNEIDFWLRFGFKLKRYTGLSKEGIKLLRQEIPVLRYDKPEVTKDYIEYININYTTDTYYCFFKGGTFSFYDDYTNQKLEGKVDSKFFEKLKSWNQSVKEGHRINEI